jgi:hypothetical protein
MRDKRAHNSECCNCEVQYPRCYRVHSCARKGAAMQTHSQQLYRCLPSCYARKGISFSNWSSPESKGIYHKSTWLWRQWSQCQICVALCCIWSSHSGDLSFIFRWKSTHVLEEHIASSFNIVRYPKQETSMQQAEHWRKMVPFLTQCSILWWDYGQQSWRTTYSPLL